MRLRVWTKRTIILVAVGLVVEMSCHGGPGETQGSPHEPSVPEKKCPFCKGFAPFMTALTGACEVGILDAERPQPRFLAKTEGVDDMTEDHWKVVNYLREYYLQYNMAPMIRKLCKQTGFKLKEIYDLFPSGPAKGACKVAGLPKPTGCV